jgi:hypothetical protein
MPQFLSEKGKIRKSKFRFQHLQQRFYERYKITLTDDILKYLLAEIRDGRAFFVCKDTQNLCTNPYPKYRRRYTRHGRRVYDIIYTSEQKRYIIRCVYDHIYDSLCTFLYSESPVMEIDSTDDIMDQQEKILKLYE